MCVNSTPSSNLTNAYEYSSGVSRHARFALAAGDGLIAKVPIDLLVPEAVGGQARKWLERRVALSAILSLISGLRVIVLEVDSARLLFEVLLAADARLNRGLFAWPSGDLRKINRQLSCMHGRMSRKDRARSGYMSCRSDEDGTPYCTSPSGL